MEALFTSLERCASDRYGRSIHETQSCAQHRCHTYYVTIVPAIFIALFFDPLATTSAVLRCSGNQSS